MAFFIKMVRLTVVSAVLGSFLLLTGCNSKGKVYCLAETDNDLVALLEDEGYDMVYGSSVDEVVKKASKGSAVLLLNAEYPKKVQKISSEVLKQIEEKQLRVFAEFATLTDAEPKIKEAVLERVVVVDSLDSDLKPMDLLSVNRGYYFEEKCDNPLLVLAKVAGFDRAEYGLKDTPAFPFFYKAAENVWVSTSQITDFAKVRFMPEHRWKKFWQWLMTNLSGKPVVFAEWPTFIKPAYGEKEVLPESARVESIRKGIEWYYNGHFLVDKSWRKDWYEKYEGDGTMPVGPELPRDLIDGDGTLGVLEGHCSAIYSDGRQAYRYWLRDDVQGESSMAFAMAGKILGNEEYMKVSERLIDFSFNEFRDGPRNDPKSPSYGLLGWARTHKGTYYGDDNARSILGMVMGAQLLNNNRWDKKIVEAIVGNFRTTGIHGFRGNSLLDKDLQEKGWKFYNQRDVVDPHPHFESWMWACYMWLYDKTGYEPLMKQSKEAIRKTMEAYPSGWHWTNGIQQERARMILPLAWLYRVEPTEEHLKWLNYMVDELLKNQVECGGIREELGDAASGMFGKTRSNAAYGLREAPLIFVNGDPIADMLYTTNFAFFALNEAAQATKDPKMLEAVAKMSDFLTRIQVRSEHFKNVDGAWFRAFNYKNWDYWASNADAGWGAWSTLTGWIQSWIVATQGMVSLDTSYWDMTKKSTVGDQAQVVFDEMLK